MPYQLKPEFRDMKFFSVDQEEISPEEFVANAEHYISRGYGHYFDIPKLPVADKKETASPDAGENKDFVPKYAESKLNRMKKDEVVQAIHEDLDLPISDLEFQNKATLVKLALTIPVKDSA